MLMGDGALVEFGNVVPLSTARWRSSTQQTLSELERAEAKRIRYRIGINSGDVIVDGDDISAKPSTSPRVCRRSHPPAASPFRCRFAIR